MNADSLPLRKRDKFLKNLFGRSREPSPGGTSTPDQSLGAPPSTQTPSLDQRLFVAALNRLTKEERDLIKRHVVHGNDDISTAVTQSYDAALDKKRACEEKRWQCTIGERKIVLRDEAEKVLNCLNMLKPIGDAVAGLDPIHIGLPWAGISALLKVVTANNAQMAALLIGMSLVLSMANRLQAYLRYLRHLSADLTTTSLEEALIKLYAHVLQFIALAIQTYGRNAARRTVEALWKTSSLEAFEAKCAILRAQADMDASDCDRVLSSRDRELATQSKAQLDEAITEINAVAGMKEAVDTLNIKLDLKELKIAEGATFNSHEDEHSARCLEGTRVALLRQVTRWADDRDGKCIFWLCGKAGTGKSTIARTVGYQLHDSNQLGASFFFKRGEGDRGRAGRFFATIVKQLTDKIPTAGKAIAAALHADSFLCEQSLRQQFEKLLLEPFGSLDMTQALVQDRVILIDALDECDRDDDMRTILKLLSRVETIGPLRLRVFVTSRPELPIRLGFQSMNGDLHQDVKLEEVQTSSIRHDIRLYYEHSFENIRETALREDPGSLTKDWPGEERLLALVNLAESLFIFAFTVCRYVEDGDPETQLDDVLKHRNRLVSGIGGLYLPILQRKISGRTTQQRNKAIADFKIIIGAIVLLADPLSVASLSSLLDLPVSQIKNTLKHLHSLLSISHEAPIRLLHLSFRDFLVEDYTTPAEEYHVEEAHTHARLADQCLRHLQGCGTLRQDICSLTRPGLRRVEIDRQKIEECIPADTACACSYWALHAIQGGRELRDNDQIHQFLQCHFLHWLEALSWLGRLSSAISYMNQLKSRVKANESAELSAFLDDALRFLLMNRYVIDLAPLQLYHSALIFTPKDSIIRKIFQHEAATQFDLLPDVILKWSAERQKLEGHDKEVTAVAFSHNSKLLASASWDKTVRVWDAETGEERQKLEGHDDRVTAVAFSHDSKLLASASEDKTVRVWDAVTGKVRQKLKGHDDTVTAVAFSHDSKLLASASWDKTVRVWDAETGEERQKLEGHDKEVTAVAFSHDSKLLASASWDKTVRVWDAETGEERQKLEGHDKEVTAVAFSHNSKLLASASWDKTVRVWDAETGEERQKLEGHDDWVTAVAFSHDSKLLASASHDKTVRVWDAETGEERQKLEGHDDRVTAVAFSHDSKLLASASEDKTVRVWDAVTGEERQKLEGHDREVTAVAFSHDSKLLASASYDKTVRVWDAVTGKVRQKLKGHDSYVTAVAFSHDSKLLASASWDDTVRVWDAVTGKVRQKLKGHDSYVTAVAFSHDSKLLASASEDKTVRVWDAVTGKVRQKLKGHDDTVTAVAFSHDSKLLASASWDDTVRVWDAVTGEERQKLSTTRHASHVEFSADGKSLRTSAGDFELHISSAAQSRSVASIAMLELQQEWLRCQGKDILWLPYEYRGRRSAAYGNTLVIGQLSGAVSFFRLKTHEGRPGSSD